MIILKEQDTLSDGKYLCRTNTGSLTGVRHSHDFYEFFLVLEGEIQNSTENGSMYIKKGQFGCMFPGKSHSVTAVENFQPLIMTLAVSKNEWELWMPLFCSAGALLSQEGIFTLNENDFFDVKESFSKLHSLDAENKILRIRSMVTKFFCAAAEAYELKTIKFENAALENALNKMREPFNLQEGMSALVRLTGYSRGHLYKILPPLCGVTPHRYILELRIKRAESLLCYTDLSVLEISMECGFSSLSHFSHIFCEEKGITPLKYRKAYKNII